MPSGHNSAETSARPTILVVDDDDMVRSVLAEAIKLAGYDVEETDDGVKALDMATATRYDLIVTDMRLPSLDGLSLIRELAARGIDTGVIVITGYGSIENAVECMKAGALEYLIKPFTVDQIHLAVAKAMDVRDLMRKAREREFFRDLSYVDALTGVFNRRYFDEALSKEVEKSHRLKLPLVLLMIDIDDFKVYNDRYGHQEGDEVLTRLGEIFKSTVRSYDIVARYGGEEFAVIFPGAGKRNAAELALRFLNAVRDHTFKARDHALPHPVTISLGVACFPDDAQDSRTLVRRADEALYEAKRTGKDRFHLWESEQ
ncbi:MAG: diguanylate cyclase [Deltaproteobacteria bacterium]|nr:diguanylate cyclase [Deltaproteobacteria bacterium]